MNLTVKPNDDGTIEITPEEKEKEKFKDLVPLETPYELKLFYFRKGE